MTNLSTQNTKIVTDNVETLHADLCETLESPELMADRSRFTSIVGRAMGWLALDDSDVADKIPVSRSAVTRWRNGSAAPLPAMRRPVYLLFRRQCERVLRARLDAKENSHA